MGCEHCYVTGPYTDILAEQIISKEFFSKYSIPSLKSVLLHGGEATELGYDSFRAILENFRHFFPEVQFRITSNLVTFDPDIINLLLEFEVEVSTSFDPKVRFQNQKQFDTWITNIYKLAAFRRPVSVLSVLTTDLLEYLPTPEAIQQFFEFLEALQIKTWRIEKYISSDFKHSDMKPSNASEADFTIRLLDGYARYVSSKPEESEVVELYSLRDLVKNFVQGGVGQPYICSACDKSSHLIFSEDGETFAICSKLSEAYTVPIAEGAKILCDTSQKSTMIQSLKQFTPTSVCQECKIQTLCPQSSDACWFQMSLDGGLVDSSHDCIYLPKFLEYYATNPEIHELWIRTFKDSLFSNFSGLSTEAACERSRQTLHTLQRLFKVE